jgi:hypothetical protein
VFEAGALGPDHVNLLGAEKCPNIRPRALRHQHGYVRPGLEESAVVGQLADCHADRAALDTALGLHEQVAIGDVHVGVDRRKVK